MTKISNQYSLTNILTADLANSRLGINNVSPTVALDVTGAGKFSSSVTAADLIISDTYTNDPLIKLATTTSGSVEVQMRTATTTYNAGIGVVTSGYDFGLFTNNTTRMTITSAGNVGIGTSSPTEMLHIYKSSGTIINLLETGSGASAFIAKNNILRGEFGVDSSSIFIQTTTAYPILFYTNNSERMRITSGGDLLINTTASHGKLTVNGTIITIGSIGDNALLSRASSKAFGWFNDGTSLLLTYSGVANVGSFNMSTGGYTATSDINKKKDFEESNIGLNEVLNIKPILYRMKTEDESSSKHLGFIAQEVKNYIPQAYTESGEFIGLTEMPIIAALTKAIQELSAKVSLLENK